MPPALGLFSTDDRLSERLAHRDAHHARNGVGRPARGIRHEHRDRLGRVLLRSRSAAQSDRKRRGKNSLQHG
jgi:hypothetical protein